MFCIGPGYTLSAPPHAHLSSTPSSDTGQKAVMATASASRPPTVATSSSTPIGNGTETRALVPTNNVTNDGVTFRARIDPTLTVEDVVKQLCIHLKVKGSPSDYALRDENDDELVTNDNLRKKIKGKVNLKYVGVVAYVSPYLTMILKGSSMPPIKKPKRLLRSFASEMRRLG
jgi:hypothetical protein